MKNEETGATYFVSVGSAFKQQLYNLLNDDPAQFIFLVRYSRGQKELENHLDRKTLRSFGLMTKLDGTEDDWAFSMVLHDVIKQHVVGEGYDMHIEG